jgi:hypothetical protein
MAASLIGTVAGKSLQPRLLLRQPYGRPSQPADAANHRRRLAVNSTLNCECLPLCQKARRVGRRSMNRRLIFWVIGGAL